MVVHLPDMVIPLITYLDSTVVPAPSRFHNSETPLFVSISNRESASSMSFLLTGFFVNFSEP
jgi:hypothetical protein